MEVISPYHYFNSGFSMSDIKIIYVPENGQAETPTIECSYHTRDLSPEEKNYINEVWEKKKQKEHLENETQLSVRHIVNGLVVAEKSTYKDWKCSANKEFFNKFGWNSIPNALNVQTLVKTKDNKLILGPRPGRGTLQIPGGMLNPDIDRIQNKIDLSKAAAREFKEEIGLIPTNIHYLGTSFYAGRVLTTMFMSGEIDLTEEQLKQYRTENSDRIKDFQDFPEIECIPATKEGVESALKTKQLQETASISLLLYGLEHFGKEWFERNSPKQFISNEVVASLKKREGR